MSVKTIAGLDAGLAANLTDAAYFPVRQSGNVDRKYTLAQVRTALGTTTSATAWSVGPNGVTNPVWQVDCSTGSQAAGLKLTGATSAGTVALQVISSGSNANLSVNAKGSGTIAIGSSSTGNVSIGSGVAGGGGGFVVDISGSTANTITDGWLKSKGATFGVGYATGAGGTVTQLTSKTTGVTLNKVCGAITMNNANLVASTIATFTVTCANVAATDMVLVAHTSGGTMGGAYDVGVTNVTAGTFDIWVFNRSGADKAEAIVLTFVVLRGVTS